VNEFWLKLKDQNIAFVPGKSSEGVFPLTYIRGISGLFISIADTQEKAIEYYKKAHTSLLN
jgi:hypothetical protein